MRIEGFHDDLYLAGDADGGHEVYITLPCWRFLAGVEESLQSHFDEPFGRCIKRAPSTASDRIVQSVTS